MGKKLGKTINSLSAIGKTIVFPFKLYWNTKHKDIIDRVATIGATTAGLSHLVNQYFNFNESDPSFLGFFKGAVFAASTVGLTYVLTKGYKKTRELISEIDEKKIKNYIKSAYLGTTITAELMLLESFKTSFDKPINFEFIKESYSSLPEYVGLGLVSFGLAKGLEWTLNKTESSGSNSDLVKKIGRTMLPVTLSIASGIALLNTYTAINLNIPKINLKPAIEYVKNSANSIGDSIVNLFDKEDVNSNRNFYVFMQSYNNEDNIDKVLDNADNVVLHRYDFTRRSKDNSELIFKKRAIANDIFAAATDEEGKVNINFIEMYSAFGKNKVNLIMNNSDKYASEIISRFDSDRFSGIMIDFESIKAGSSDSDNLVNFMKVLRSKLDELSASKNKDYSLGIAVSPRFKGSEKYGYPHHGFYDYESLDEYVDNFVLMGYDFNVPNAGPSIPEDKIDDILRYAIDHIDDPNEIIIAFAAYGRVFDEHGKAIKSNALSEKYNYKYVKGVTFKKYINGELCTIRKKDGRRTYAQTPEGHRNKLSAVDKFNKSQIEDRINNQLDNGKPIGNLENSVDIVTNVALWRASHAGDSSIKKYKDWVTVEINYKNLTATVKSDRATADSTNISSSSN